MKRRAFTLIETLAVVTLIGLAAVLLSPLLLGVAGSSRIDNAMRRALDLDARARLVAQGDRGAVIVIGDNTWTLLIDNKWKSETIAEWNHGAMTEINVSTGEGEMLNRIVYDAAGRSVDLNISVGHGALNQKTQIAGLTGWVKPEGGW